MTYKIKSAKPVLALTILLDAIDCFDWATRKPGQRNGIGVTTSAGDFFYVYRTKGMTWVIVQDEKECRRHRLHRLSASTCHGSLLQPGAGTE